MADIIKGIPNSKLKRLEKHLLKLKEKAGKPLRRRMRGHFWESFREGYCPIMNFAPNKNADGFPFVGCNFYGKVGYKRGGKFGHSYEPEECDSLYSIYSLNDSEWWKNLSYKSRRQVTQYIQSWIKNGR